MTKKLLSLSLVLILSLTSCSTPAPANNPTTTDDSYISYTGYLDECTDWTDSTEFAGQDYDADGTTDRIYRQYNDSDQTCTLRFDLGSNQTFTVEGLSAKGRLFVQGIDFNADGVNEIFIKQDAIITKEERVESFIAVYEKQDNEYKKLPFEKTLINPTDQTEPSLRLKEEYFEREGVRVITCDLTGSIYVDHMICLHSDILERYHNEVGDEFEHWTKPFACEIMDGKDNEKYLSLKYKLLEKWAVDQVNLTVAFQDGELKVTGSELIEQ